MSNDCNLNEPEISTSGEELEEHAAGRERVAQLLGHLIFRHWQKDELQRPGAELPAHEPTIESAVKGPAKAKHRK